MSTMPPGSGADEISALRIERVPFTHEDARLLEVRPRVPMLRERAQRILSMLMDVYMPGMDGREATRQLRATEGPNRHIPVIAVTASATAKDWDACRAAGMDAHVAKPIDPSQLHAALSEVLSVGASRVAA